MNTSPRTMNTSPRTRSGVHLLSGTKEQKWVPGQARNDETAMNEGTK
jgi:hypothetical protein